MRGMTWEPTGGFRCGDCGGFGADLLPDGTARCRGCGRVSVPHVPRPAAGLGRAVLWILALFVAVFVVEIVLASVVSAGSTTVFRRVFIILAFATGLVALVVGGIGAAPGRVALRTQRLDYLGRMIILQNPVEAGVLSTEAEARTAEEPGAAGIFLFTGLGLALIVAAFIATVA